MRKIKIDEVYLIPFQLNAFSDIPVSKFRTVPYKDQRLAVVGFVMDLKCEFIFEHFIDLMRETRKMNSDILFLEKRIIIFKIVKANYLNRTDRCNI